MASYPVRDASTPFRTAWRETKAKYRAYCKRYGYDPHGIEYHWYPYEMQQRWSDVVALVQDLRAKSFKVSMEGLKQAYPKEVAEEEAQPFPWPTDPDDTHDFLKWGVGPFQVAQWVSDMAADSLLRRIWPEIFDVTYRGSTASRPGELQARLEHGLGRR